MKRRPIIIDACTLINLIRIDEDDMLYNYLLSFNIKIAECVYKEIENNIFKSDSSKEMREKVNILLPRLLTFIETDDSIKANIGNSECAQIKKLTHHIKEDGEYYSLLLSLYQSRYFETQINLYTDDKRAMQQFEEYFNLQQLGVSGDSIDLILFLYWHSNRISEMNLHRLLSNLRFEYCKEERIFIQEIEKFRAAITNNRKNSSIIRVLNSIIMSYRQGKYQQLYKAIDEIKNFPGKEIKQIIRKFAPNPSTVSIVEKINHVESLLIAHKISLVSR